ncbi:alpha/beta hydrolase [Candidatus Synechococcus calcipolaris G9]|uniref:Alpha/beta hydrolase n=1 Tax=Candidatus Synechococcus calcipolaris G9 TaxID=1497997 RepID=A0ABT6F0B1_9SYNE|nr:alpha/beta hydrolase [Candidatus Synechococcus calcipolaris]MDG2991300.1 alpha/beta hydrolase [Candidatus Synechococcus calcipolaris G9]
MAYCPPSFRDQKFSTNLGQMTYYTPSEAVWGSLQDRLPLIFLHSLGGGSSHYEWSKVYPAFAADYRVIAPDLIGWGASDHPAHAYQVSDYWLMTAEIIRPLAQPVAVVASSLMAGIVIRLAIQQPQLFRALCLVCPTGFNDFGNDEGRGLAGQFLGIPGLDQLVYGLGAANVIAVRNFLEQFIFADGDRLSQETVSAYLDSALQPGASHAALAALRGDLSFDLARYLPQLTVPTVIFWGEKAQLSPLETGQRLRDLNPTALRSFRVIPNAGVLPHLEVPEAVLYGISHDFLPLLNN